MDGYVLTNQTKREQIISSCGVSVSCSFLRGKCSNVSGFNSENNCLTPRLLERGY